MDTYIGTKMVKARPMGRAEYNDYRGWELPFDEEGSDKGYLVEFIDGGQPNHPDHEGYISWSPDKVFKKAYLSIGIVDYMPGHKQRMAAELAQLQNRLNKLSTFIISSPAFMGLPPMQQHLMEDQRDAMESYSEILSVRLLD